MSFLLSEEGQKVIYLGVEGETYTEENGVISLIPEVDRILNSDREEYNAKYGADDTYWMLQNNVMQLKWKLPLKEPRKQLEEWTYPYTTYLGKYDVIINEDSEIGRIYSACRELWGTTLPRLLLAGSDEEFDEILEEYISQRTSLGYDRLMEEETRQMIENKKRLGME